MPWQSGTSSREGPSSAFIYSGSREEQDAVAAALSVIESLFRDPEFRELIANDNDWIARAERCEGTSEFTVKGTTVVDAVLKHRYVNVHYLVNRHFGAVATTDIYRNATAINPYQAAKWYRSDAESRGELINTISHELTHLVPTATQFVRFTDSGHSRCTEAKLVSYKLGRVTECFYLARTLKPEVNAWRGAFQSCMANTPTDPTDADGSKCQINIDALKRSCEGP